MRIAVAVWRDGDGDGDGDGRGAQSMHVTRLVDYMENEGLGGGGRIRMSKARERVW